MKKVTKAMLTAVLLLGVSIGVTDKADASTSQLSYKLTAYNNKGKKVYVNASKGMTVTPYKTGWYKGTVKYTNYTKKGKKWVSGTKTTTIYIPYTVVNTVYGTKTTYKPTTEYQLFKTVKTIDVATIDFYNTEYDTDNGYTYSEGMNVRKGLKILDEDGYFISVTDANGYSDQASTLEEITISTVDYENGTGKANNVKYIDYQEKEVKVNKPFKEFTTSYKTNKVTQVYSKVYIKSVVKNGITKAEFKKLRIGMSYEEVAAIIGEDGKLTYSTGIYEGVDNKLHMGKVYEYKQKGQPYAWATISLTDNKVDSIKQYALQ